MGDEHYWTNDGIAKALAVRDLALFALSHGWDEHINRATGEVTCRGCGKWQYTFGPDGLNRPSEQRHQHRPDCVVMRARVALI